MQQVTWDYRIIRQELANGTTMHGLHEVYYNADGSLRCATVEPIDLSTVSGLDFFMDMLDKVRRAGELPVLDFEQFTATEEADIAPDTRMVQHAG